jgi:hypothetical protein
MRLTDAGFAADRVLSVQIALPETRYGGVDRQRTFFDALLDGARRLPGVTAASIGYGAVPPSDFLSSGTLVVDATGEARYTWLATSFVQPGYFDLMGIPRLAGRDLTAEDRYNPATGASLPAVVSRLAADRLSPGRDPIGQTFRLENSRGTMRYQVIGVVGDVGGLEALAGGCRDCFWQVYLPLPDQRRFSEILLRVADGAPLPVTGLRAAVQTIDPDVPADEELQDGATSVARLLNQPRFRAALFGGFAVLALVLVAIGLGAVLSHAVGLRAREVGIRLALGARPGDERRRLLFQGLRPALVGLGLGLAAAMAAARAMTAFLNGHPPLDVPVLATTALAMVLVASVAVLVPARRVTRLDPSRTLRSD